MNRLRQWMGKHQALLELAVDLLSGWLLAGGWMALFCACLVSSVLAEVTSGQILLYTFTGMAAVTVLSRRWWILPGAAAVGAAGLWLFSRTAGWEPFLEKVAAYAGWCLSGCPASAGEAGGEVLPDPAWICLLIAAGFCAAAFLFMRRLFCYPLMFAVSGIGIGLAAYGVYREWIAVERLWFVTALLLMCLIVTLPRMYAGYLEKTASDRSAGQSEGGRMGISRISLQILAVPAAFLCVGMAFWIVPQDASGWKSETLTNLVLDVSDLLRFSFGTSEGYWEFSLSSASFYPLGDRLGGPVELSDNHIMEVKTDYPVLLKGSVQDTYTGSGWTDSRDNGRFRLESKMWSGKRKKAMGTEPSGNQAVQKLYQRLTAEVTLEVFPKSDRYCTIFTPGRLEDVQFRKKSEQILFFNEQGEVFTQEPVGSSYLVTGRVFLPRDAGRDREMEQLERLVSDARDKDYDNIAGQCLQLPDSLPERVRQQTAEIINDAQTPYQRAAAIADWLEKNCTYTLTPSEPPEDRDFVDWFLETREGYCTYYASAMTVMARCAGLPARYVSGFGLKENILKDWYYISDASGHAWTEIYFSGIGWIPFDPLGWNPAGEVPEHAPAESAPDDSADTAAEETEEEEELPPLTPLEETQDSREYGLWILLAVLAAGGAVYGLVLIFRYPDRHWTEEAVVKRALSPARWTEAFYRDILRQLELAEFVIRPGETLLEFACRVDERLPLERDDHPMERIAGWITALRFGGEEPPADNLRWLCRYHEQVEHLLYVRLGRWNYFWKRCVSSLISGR